MSFKGYHSTFFALLALLQRNSFFFLFFFNFEVKLTPTKMTSEVKSDAKTSFWNFSVDLKNLTGFAASL